jgi:hypothetical protein
MSTEVWFRNPHNYVRELAEVLGPDQPLIVWDRGILVKKLIDPVKHAKIYFGENTTARILCVGPQGTAELDKDHGLDRPLAVYPTWEYGEDFGILEEMCASPIGEDIDACSADVPKDERPVIGQEHRVVITNLPNAQQAANRPFYRHLMELQEENSHCTIMLHGSYSYRIMFGHGFGAADVEPRSDAANGKVHLPNGRILAYARTVQHQQWVNVVGMSVTDLKEPKNRCKFNIRSAMWAGEYFMEQVKFKSQGQHEVDYDSPHTIPATTAAVRSRNVLEAVQTGDKINCDTCSLQETCKYYREGSACTLPGAETTALVAKFQSRDSGHIIDGLGVVLGAQIKRLQRGMDTEEELEVLDPEVTKIMNQVFQNGKTLAKLVDPNLSKPLVQINGVNGGGGSRQEVVASVFRALEAQGFSRDQITDSMFEATLAKMYPELVQKAPMREIEATG